MNQSISNQTTRSATEDSAATSPDDTRAALLDAGRALFVTKGFDGASVRAITDRAGASLGAITYHFGSKRALYQAVLEQELTPLADRVLAAAERPGPVPDRMAAIVGAYFDHFRGHPDLPRLMLQEIAAGKEPPPVVAETLRRVMRTLVRLQEQGVSDGTLHPGHPVLTALSVVSQPIYMTLVAPLLRMLAGVDLGDEETRRLAVDHATGFVRAGLAARPPHHDGGPTRPTGPVGPTDTEEERR